MSDLDADLRRKYRAAVAALPRKQREIFLAHLLDELPYDAIVAREGLTIRQVERHIADAIYKIDKQMDGKRLNWCERWF